MVAKVGTIVKIAVPEMLGNKEGVIGVCYELYPGIGRNGEVDGTGGSFIFANGSYDGFSWQDQERYLEEYGITEDPDLLSYEFTNVMKLSDDFRNGLFDSVFKEKVFRLNEGVVI